MTTPHIPIPQDALADLCRRYHIRRLALFGSVLRDDFRPDSDIDILVEFQPGRVIGWGIARIERELSQLFGGRKIDLHTPAELSRYFRDQVLRDAQVQYAQA